MSAVVGDAYSQGVFFVDTAQGAVVVKGTRSLASEVFAALLAFKLGIVAPRFRVVPTGSKFGTSNCALRTAYSCTYHSGKGLRSAVEFETSTLPEHASFGWKIRFMSHGGNFSSINMRQFHLLVKSYVVGTSLSQTTFERASAIFGVGFNRIHGVT